MGNGAFVRQFALKFNLNVDPPPLGQVGPGQDGQDGVSVGELTFLPLLRVRPIFELQNKSKAVFFPIPSTISVARGGRAWAKPPSCPKLYTIASIHNVLLLPRQPPQDFVYPQGRMAKMAGPGHGPTWRPGWHVWAVKR